jgi:hypothetical protein
MLDLKKCPSWASRLFYFIMGVSCILLGGFCVIYVYGFASMVDPDLICWERTWAIWKKVLLTPSVIVFLLGLGWIGFGLWQCVRSMKATTF